MILFYPPLYLSFSSIFIPYFLFHLSAFFQLHTISLLTHFDSSQSSPVFLSSFFLPVPSCYLFTLLASTLPLCLFIYFLFFNVFYFFHLSLMINSLCDK